MGWVNHYRPRQWLLGVAGMGLPLGCSVGVLAGMRQV